MSTDPARQIVGILADNIIETDDFVADARERFGDLYIEILNSPERRDDRIESRYIEYFFLQSIDEIGDESHLQYWQSVAQAMEMTWDELNSIPPNKRGRVFIDVRSIMSAVAWEQAYIESGLALRAISTGLSLGDDVRSYASKFDPQKISGGSGIRTVIDEKLESRKVGTSESQFLNREDETDEEAEN